MTTVEERQCALLQIQIDNATTEFAVLRAQLDFWRTATGEIAATAAALRQALGGMPAWAQRALDHEDRQD
jgi:hypothetical protein